MSETGNSIQGPKLSSTNKSKEQQQKIVKNIMEKREQILEQFAQAYLAQTGLAPEDIELVEERKPTNRIVWYFQKKRIIEIVGGNT